MGAVILVLALGGAVAGLLVVDADLARASEMRLEAQLTSDAARVSAVTRARWRSLVLSFHRAIETDRAPGELAEIVSIGGRVGSVRLYRTNGGVSVWTPGGWTSVEEDEALLVASLANHEPGSVEFGNPSSETDHLIVGRREDLPDNVLTMSVQDAEGVVWTAALPAVEYAGWVMPAVLDEAGVTARIGPLATQGALPRRVRVTRGGLEVWSTPVGVTPGEGRVARTVDRVRTENTLLGVGAPETDDLLFIGPTGGGLDMEIEVAPAEGTISAVLTGERRTRLVMGFAVVFLAGTAGVTLLFAATRSLAVAERQRAFVSLVSHEIRTPLAALRGAMENLRDGVVRDPSRYAVLIETQLRRIEDLAEDALEVARTGTPVPLEERRPIDVPRLVADVVAEFGPEVTLESSDDGAPDESPNSNVIASERELRRSVQNLIRNALLHGSPPVTVAVRDADSGVQILVTDHGPGFGGDDPVRLRRPFERGTTAIADQRPGSGLGLAVASDVVAGLGGSLHLADGPDGAVATITLPTR